MDRRKKVILDRTLAAALTAMMAMQGAAPAMAWAAEVSAQEQAAKTAQVQVAGDDDPAAEEVTEQSEPTAQAEDASIFAGGTGTAEDPYQISSLDQFKAFRDSVNAGTSYQGKFVKLTASIDLKNEEWEPIGVNTTNYFKGKFDGGYSEENPVAIKNLKINCKGDHTGLFGYTWGASFKNVCLENVDVTGAKSTGALVSFAVGNIDNCHAKGAIKIQGGNDFTYHFTAALAAQLYGNATDCTVVGDEGSTITALGKVGAIVGFLRENQSGVYAVKNCTVKNIAVKATGSWQGDAGAIVGGAYPSTVIEGCTADTVVVSGNAAGGIIGLIENPLKNDKTGEINTKDGKIQNNKVIDSTVSGKRSGYILGVYRKTSNGLTDGLVTTSENYVVNSSGANGNGDAGRDGDTFDGEPFKYVTVTFAKNDGTGDGFGSKTNFKDGTVSALGSQTRAGYVFKGWYKDAACTEEFDFSQKITEDTTVYAGWAEAVVSKTGFLGSVTYYTSVQEALNSASSVNYTYTLLQDTTESVTLPAGKKATLDLNGHKLTNAAGSHTITNNGTLTIKDSSKEKTGTVDNVSNGRGALYNGVKGVLAVDGGNFTRSAEASIPTYDAEHSGNANGNSWYVVKNFGTMTINGGEFKFSDSNQGFSSSLVANGWFNEKDSGDKADYGKTVASLTINGGTLTGGKIVVKNDDYSKLSVTGGNIVQPYEHYYALVNYHEAEISGGIITSKGNAVSNQVLGSKSDIGKLTISGGTITSETKMAVVTVRQKTEVTDGLTTITGGTFNAGAEAIGTGPGCTTEVSGGTFNSGAGHDVSKGDGTTSISGGTFNTVVRDVECAEGFVPVTEPDEDGNYTVAPKAEETTMTAMGAGLKLDNHTDNILSTDYDRCGIRFGYRLTLPEDATDVKFTWTVTVDGKSATVTGTNYDTDTDNNVVCNLVITDLAAKHYETDMTVTAKMTYTTEDGREVTVDATTPEGIGTDGAVTRNVKQVAECVVKNATDESEQAVRFCNGLLDWYNKQPATEE